MAEGWRGFGGAILLLLSGRDLTAREFIDHAAGDAAWQGLLAGERVERCDLPEADHTFSNAAARREVEQKVTLWLLQLEAIHDTRVQA